jgi:2,3-bisphosphoglycerate-dependent phosphoglycerate mutase
MLMRYPKRFLLVRHGESIWNQDSKFTGWTDIPLTEKGKREASIIAKVLHQWKFKTPILK